MKRTLTRLAYFLCPAVALVLAQTAQAGDCTVIDALDGFASAAVSPERATCATYVTRTAETGAYCFWDFPYRSAAAAGFAEAMWENISKCRSGGTLGSDTPVNHPDSYDLREWQSARGVYALSIKDKGSLGRTLVFVRFEPRTGADIR